MTIFGLGYRPLSYRPTPPIQRIWALARREAVVLFRSKWGVVLFFVCLLPWLLRLGIMLVAVGALDFEPMQMVLERHRQLDHFLNPWSTTFYLDGSLYSASSILPLLVLTVLLGSRTVARDRMANALEILWTRGIGPRGYMVGKWLGCTLLLGMVFIAPPLLIWIMGALMAPDWGFATDTVGPLAAAMPSLVLFTGLLGFLAVTTSAVCTTANLASLMWLGVLLGSLIVASVVDTILGGNTAWPAMNPWVSAGRIAEQLAGEVSTRAFGPGVAWLSMALWCVGLPVLAAPRLRLEDAIG